MLASYRVERGGPYPHAKVLICYGPGLDPSILRHSGIWGAADETVLNKVLKR